MNVTSQAPSTALVRVLFAGKDPSDHRLVADLLDSVPDNRFLIEWTRSLADSMDRLEHADFDVCLLDACLPDGDSLDLLRSIGSRGLMLPVLILANGPSKAKDQRALSLGAAAYLEKDQLDPTTLERSIRYAIGQQKIIAGLARQSFLDETTGLINQTLYRDRLERALGFARRRDREVAVVMIDLALEDEQICSERLVDVILAETGRRLANDLRETDSIARLSDRRFALLIEGMRSLDHAAKVARKVLRRLRTPIDIEGEAVSLKPSLGVAIYPREGGDGDTLMRQAETAMRRAMVEDHGRLRFGSEHVDCEARESMVLDKAFGIAFSQRELRLRFRPEIKLTGSRSSLVGEVFWRHPDQGWLPLQTSLSDTDDETLIKGIVDWSFASAVEQLLTWNQEGLERQRLSLALPFRRQPALALLKGAVRKQVISRHVAPNRIALDLEEDLIIDDVGRSCSDLTSLKATGVRLTLNDVGRGRLAIRDIRHDILDGIKLAPSLCRGLTSGDQNIMLLRALINFGHGLDMNVTAKGPRDQHQFAILKQLGCDAVQLSSVPAMSATAATAWLRALGNEAPLKERLSPVAPETLVPNKRPLSRGRVKSSPPRERR